MEHPIQPESKVIDNPYRPGKCWAGVVNRRSGPLEHCGDPLARHYLVIRRHDYAVLRAFMWLCKKHRKRIERAGYTCMPA